MMQRITGNMDESLADLGVESMKIEERDPPSVEALRRTTRTDFLKDWDAWVILLCGKLLWQP